MDDESTERLAVTVNGQMMVSVVLFVFINYFLSVHLCLLAIHLTCCVHQ